MKFSVETVTYSWSKNKLRQTFGKNQNKFLVQNLLKVGKLLIRWIGIHWKN